MTGIRPYLSARMRGRQWIDLHVQDVRDFRRTRFVFEAVSDRHLLHPKVLADQRRQLRHWSSGSAGEDRTQSFSLFIAGAFIDVSSDRPIAVRHRSGRMDGERHIETVQWRAIKASALDMKYECHIAHAFGRP